MRGRKQWYHLGNFEAKGSGWWRLTVRHAVSYVIFLTASEQRADRSVYLDADAIGSGLMKLTR